MKPKTIIYRSTYAEQMDDFFKKQLSPLEYEMLWMLYYSYRIPTHLKSAYFELIRVGDGKYTLNVQKYVDDTFSVKFTINSDYSNNAERFTY